MRELKTIIGSCKVAQETASSRIKDLRWTEPVNTHHVFELWLMVDWLAKVMQELCEYVQALEQVRGDVSSSERRRLCEWNGSGC